MVLLLIFEWENFQFWANMLYHQKEFIQALWLTSLFDWLTHCTFQGHPSGSFMECFKGCFTWDALFFFQTFGTLSIIPSFFQKVWTGTRESSPPSLGMKYFAGILFFSVGGQEGILTIWTFLTIKYWTLIKIKISMTSVYKEYKVNIKL